MFKHLLLFFFILSLITFGLCDTILFIDNDGTKKVNGFGKSETKIDCGAFNGKTVYLKITSQINTGAKSSYVNYIIPAISKHTSMVASICDVFRGKQSQPKRPYTYSRVNPDSDGFDGTSEELDSVRNSRTIPFLGGSGPGVVPPPQTSLPFWGDNSNIKVGGCCIDGEVITNGNWGMDYTIEVIDISPTLVYLNNVTSSKLTAPYKLNVSVTDMYSRTPEGAACSWSYNENETGVPVGNTDCKQTLDLSKLDAKTQYTFIVVLNPGAKGLTFKGTTLAAKITRTFNVTTGEAGLAPDPIPSQTPGTSSKPSSFQSYKISCVLMAIIAFIAIFKIKNI